MARARNIKPTFHTNEVLGDCSPLARILFTGLWCHADRTGVLEYRPKKLKIEVLPWDECDVHDLMHQLIVKEFVVPYVVDGRIYLYIPTFKKHQSPHKDEKPKGFPAMTTQNTMPASCWPSVDPEATALIADCFNLIPDSLKGAASPPANEVLPDDGLPPAESPPLPARLRAEDILLPPSLTTPEFIAARNAWFSQRRRKRLSLRIEYVERAYTRLLPLGPANAAACLMHTVDNDYDGIFPEKFNGKPKSTNSVGAGQRFRG